MAERRMFAKTIIDSDAFLDMPLSTQALYFHLGMRADDDGFVNGPKKVQRMVGASEDDLKLLIAKRFVLTFDSGVIVIKHWKMHNYIQKDRYKPTVYLEERATLELQKNGSYTELKENPIPLDSERFNELSPAREARSNAKKESCLPSTFDNVIRNAFVGEKCPICGVAMSYESNLTMPTIQHNVPISLGGKHEIDNISVICRHCNSSIQNRRITEPYNTEKVKEIWECIGNVSTLDTQVSIGKDSIGKDSIGKDNIIMANQPVDNSSADGFIKPNINDVRDYAIEIAIQTNLPCIDVNKWYAYYEKNNWMCMNRNGGMEPMKDWRRSVQTWYANEKKKIKQDAVNKAADQQRRKESAEAIRNKLKDQGIELYSSPDIEV